MFNELTVQQYADYYCNGDRYRAIYEMFRDSQGGSFNKHIDELDRDESAFVLNLTFQPLTAMRKKYGSDLFSAYITSGKKGLKAVAQETQNPYKKSIVLMCIAVAVSIIILVVAGILGSTVVSVIAGCFGGLISMCMVSVIMSYFNFKKTKKAVDEAPEAIEDMQELKDVKLPPFEEVFKDFLEHHTFEPKISQEQAEWLIRTSRNDNIAAITLMPVHAFNIFMAAVFTSLSKFLAVSIVVFVAIAIAQVVVTVRSAKRTDGVLNVVSDTGVYVDRKSKCQTVAYLLAMLYVVMFLVSILFCCIVLFM